MANSEYLGDIYINLHSKWLFLPADRLFPEKIIPRGYIYCSGRRVISVSLSVQTTTDNSEIKAGVISFLAGPMGTPVNFAGYYPLGKCHTFNLPCFSAAV